MKASRTWCEECGGWHSLCPDCGIAVSYAPRWKLCFDAHSASPHFENHRDLEAIRRELSDITEAQPAHKLTRIALPKVRSIKVAPS